MGPTFTLKDLREGVLRWRLDPLRARKALLEVRDLIDVLLTTDDDIKRIKAYKKLARRLTLGYGRMDLLVFWSKIASTGRTEVELERKQAEKVCPEPAQYSGWCSTCRTKHNEG